MVQRNQDGHVYEVRNAAGKVISFHIRFRVTELKDGKPVRVLKSHKLCDRDDKYFSVTCKAVEDKRKEFMAAISPVSGADMSVAEFWKQRYLPFIREHKKPSTVSGYEQIWSQHLEAHFAGKTLREYRTHMGSQFLLTLTKTQGQRTLNHIRSLASGIFSHAVNLGLLELNAWHNVKILGKVTPPTPTEWYTLEEAENIISALVNDVDCQLIMALACFQGLRPGEIAALRWEDFDAESVHIRRAVVRGVLGSTKTPESVATLPLLDRARLFLELWRRRCGDPSEGWVFPNKNNKPADLKDMVRRRIRPAVQAAGLQWKELYAGRRGAGTALVGLTGSLVAAQELLRHKSLTTTATFYKKLTQSALADGVKALDAALQSKALTARNEGDE